MLGEAGLSAASSHGVEQRRPCQPDDNRVAKKTITIVGGESSNADAGNNGGAKRQLHASRNIESLGWLNRGNVDSNRHQQRARWPIFTHGSLDRQRNDRLGWR